MLAGGGLQNCPSSWLIPNNSYTFTYESLILSAFWKTLTWYINVISRVSYLIQFLDIGLNLGNGFLNSRFLAKSVLFKTYFQSGTKNDNQIKLGSETKDNEIWNIIWKIMFPNNPRSEVMTVTYDLTFGFSVFI